MEKLKAKFFYSVLILLLTFINKSYAQDITSDELPVNQIAILRNKGKAAPKKFNILESPTHLVTAFGKPLRKTVEFAEMDQLDYTVYRYENAEFSFYKNSLVYFRIMGPGFSVLTQSSALAKKADKYIYKVGEPISRVKAVYPKSYNARNSDGVISFLLYQLNRNPKTQKTSKTRLDNTLAFFSKDEIITDLILDH